ncbi:hypothetical protein HPB51_019357 [Rhipicephalus microplus]|uniref:Uncharacterized protein n=1 Tax=Rhipicephalus microplus TaxID=6941 RepID=A0A9J6DBF8_RHIMP|nr:hypothetical protein HPB51_019357 [Rhipicephalus microplus]
MPTSLALPEDRGGEQQRDNGACAQSYLPAPRRDALLQRHPSDGSVEAALSNLRGETCKLQCHEHGRVKEIGLSILSYENARKPPRRVSDYSDALHVVAGSIAPALAAFRCRQNAQHACALVPVHSERHKPCHEATELNMAYMARRPVLTCPCKGCIPYERLVRRESRNSDASDYV